MTAAGANLQWLSQYPAEAEVCFPPLTAIDVVSSRVQASVLVVTTRPSLCSRATGTRALNRASEDLASRDRAECAIGGIGEAASAVVSRLTGADCTVQRTPMGDPTARLAPPSQSSGARVGESRVRLLDTSALRLPKVVALDAFLLVSRSAGDGAQMDRGAQSRLDVLLEVVCGAATELYDAVAHDEVLTTRLDGAHRGDEWAREGEASTVYWAGQFMLTFYTRLSQGVRAAVNPSAWAALRGAAAEPPPPAVVPCVIATLALLASAAGGDVLPELDLYGMSTHVHDWHSLRRLLKSVRAHEGTVAGVAELAITEGISAGAQDSERGTPTIESMLHTLDHTALTHAVAAFVPSQVSPAVWSRVSVMAEQGSLAEVATLSYGRAVVALQHWIGGAALLGSFPELLVLSSGSGRSHSSS